MRARAVALVLGGGLAATWLPAQAASTDPPWIADRDGWRGKAVAERHAERRKSEEAVVAAAEGVGKPWRVTHTKRLVVLAKDADRKMIGEATRSAEVLLAWCDSQFGGITDDYVRRRVLRVGVVDDPKEATTRGTALWRGLTLDVDRELEQLFPKGAVDRVMMSRRLFVDVLDVYLMDVDPMLFRYMPEWLTWGLAECVGTAEVERNALRLQATHRERDAVRGNARKGRARTLRQILTMGQAEAANALESDARFEFAKAVRFFLAGPGAKLKPAQGFLAEYMRAVIDAVEKLRPEWTPLPATGLVQVNGALTVPASGALAKWSPRREAVGKLAFESACGSWTEADWTRLEKAFAGYQPR